MYLRSLYPLPELPPTNYHNFIFRGPQQSEIPDHVLYIDGVTGQTRTRSEFLERLYDGATALGAGKNVGGLGFTSSDLVGVLSDNCLVSIVQNVHSLIAITTPFALFSTHATPRELRHSIGISKATYIFVHASLLSQYLPIAHDTGFPVDHIYILEGQDTTGLNRPSFGQLIEKVRSNKIPREPVRQAGKDTLAYLVFSSGTSGLPKAVMVSHGNLVLTMMQGVLMAQEHMKTTHPPPDDASEIPIVLGYLPMSHALGLHFMCLRTALWPTTIVLLPRWDVKTVLKAIPKYRVTILILVPSVIYQLVNDPEFDKTDFSSIKTATSGAASLPAKLLDKFESALPKTAYMTQGYGMSEATLSLMAQAQPGLLEGRVESDSTSTGILLPGVDAMILRPDGTHSLPNESGELYIKADNVTLGYWNNPEATKEAFLSGGWLRTGDLFKANTKGSFWFEDRAKDTLKISGLQVSPAEIEEVLFSEPSGIVRDAAVAGVQMPGARMSDERNPRAWVVLTAQGVQLGEQEARERLERWVKTNLSKYKWLRGGIQFVPEIPKNPTGKVLRRVLQDQYAAESARTKL